MIEVNDIRVFAFHGCLEEEGRIGGNYRVHVRVEGDFALPETTDELRDTVDYSRVTAIVLEQMAVRSKLIEHVARRILDHLKAEWPRDLQWHVRVVKENPPIAGAVGHVVYDVEG